MTSYCEIYVKLLEKLDIYKKLNIANLLHCGDKSLGYCSEGQNFYVFMVHESTYLANFFTN